MEYFSLPLVVLILSAVLYYYYHKANQVLEDLWLQCSLNFGVSMAEMQIEGKKRAQIKRPQGVLYINYPLSAVNQMGKGENTHTSTTRYKTSELPAWFAFSTRAKHDGAFLQKLVSPSPGMSLLCAGVDLSDHIPPVLYALFGDDDALLRNMSPFNTNVRAGKAMFDATYSIETSSHEVVRNVERFAHMVEHLIRALPKRWEEAFAKILAQTSDPALFDRLNVKLNLTSDSSNRHLLKDVVSTASDKALALWCTKGLLGLVRESLIPRTTRERVFAEWGKLAPLADRARMHPESHEMISYFCEHETLEQLEFSNINRTPQLVLPMLMHFFEQAPEHVWEESKKLIALLKTDEARMWIDHLERSGHPAAPEHLIRMRLSDTMHPAMAQKLMRHINELCSTHPEALQDRQLNQNIAHLLKFMSEEVFERSCEWLKRVGTLTTLSCLRTLDKHFSKRSSQRKTLEQAIDLLAQRVGRAGGLSLSADGQAGGLSISGGAQKGDMTFDFEEHTAQATSSSRKKS